MLSSTNNKWRDQRLETSPERNRVWTEPPPKHKSDRKVAVVYYLTRNGQLEHPHFIEVPLSPSSDGLYLRDVINRLNSLRGKSMAAMYSWSSKRSYKNGFVWHDLGENDFIYPAHGQEYVLKGSELLEGALVSKIDRQENLTSKQQPPPETSKPGDVTDFPLVTRRKNQSWSAIDLHEYKVVYKADSSGELTGRAAADASTQTDEKRRRRRGVKEIEEEREENLLVNQTNHTTELSREEISPPPSDSSPETLESLMKADGKLIRHTGGRDDLTANNHPSGRMKASTVLMQLLTCGSISFKDCGPGYTKDHPGFSLISQYKPRLPRGGGEENTVEKEKEKENPNFGIGIGNGGKITLEDKEYFSGSLIQETKKDEFPALKRSSSYNADRSSRIEMKDKEEMEGPTDKCIPRRPRMQKPTIN